LVAPRRKDRRLLEELATESFAELKLALSEFSLSRAELARAMARALKMTKVPPVSGRVTSEYKALGKILIEWSRGAAYADDAGKPRVLMVKGPGATFESLARRALPNRSVNEVVERIRRVAEVSMRPQGKIALLGSVLVNIMQSDESHLAHMNRQLEHFFSTSRFNRRMAKRGAPERRMERLATHVIASDQVESFMEEVKPRIYNMLMGVENAMDRRNPKGKRAKGTVVGVGVYMSAEENLERAGYGPIRPRSRARARITLASKRYKRSRRR
jgi:hypothetical protein